MDGSGKVDIDDLLLLRRYFSRWNVTLLPGKVTQTAGLQSESAMLQSVPVMLQEEDTPQIVVESQNVHAGDEIAVPVLLKNNPGIVAFLFGVRYDADKLEYLGAEDGDYQGAVDDIRDTTQAGNPLYLNFTSASRSNLTGEIAGVLKFRVKGNATGSALFTVEIDEDFGDGFRATNDQGGSIPVDFAAAGGFIEVLPDASTSQFVISDVPTTNDGNPVTAANPGTISAITVPIRYFGAGEQVIEIAAAFYDADGRFAGFGMTSATVNDQTNAVTIPVRQYADRLKTLKIMMLNTRLVPLISASSYDLP